MTSQGVRWTAEQVLSLAPDAPSRKAGSKLGTAGPWSGTGTTEEGVVWGLCKGSGSKPYQALADVAGPAYACSCPSRKFPCKHVLGLLLLWSAGPGAVPAGEPPEWAGQWLEKRRARAEKSAGGAGAGSAEKADPEAARKRAERRAERVTAGARELEQRLADLLRGGLASAERAGYGMWEETAARMVDAQAKGLATRVRELGAIPGSGPGWPVRLLEESALLHLLVRGWTQRESLPAPLAATVARRLGLPETAPPPEGERDVWLVLGQYDTQEGSLTTRRIWLHGTRTGRTALLLSYGAAGAAPEVSLPVGLGLDAELRFHPARPRATLGERFGPVVPVAGRPRGLPLAEAAERYGALLAEDPWLDSWPVTLDGVIPVRGPDGWQLAEPSTGTALPLPRSFTSTSGLWRLLATSGGRPLRVFGECGHRGFQPLAAWEPDGAEHADGTEHTDRPEHADGRQHADRTERATAHPRTPAPLLALR
ncbi:MULTISPECIES: SWIM zinc finger family protein [unclassified Streptomyces]|nr:MULTISPECIES: SWIM zinc finger family protein [unclassified Streptomyces]MYR25289.1 SWIM zinc finger family protein [Streptomyces sp. SID4945]SCE78002.1 SWIM zinc finger [Streptomyces sp. LcepLS]